MFQRKKLPLSSGQMEGTGSSKMSVCTYHETHLSTITDNIKISSERISRSQLNRSMTTFVPKDSTISFQSTLFVV
jgi:hypothetical protein